MLKSWMQSGKFSVVAGYIFDTLSLVLVFINSAIISLGLQIIFLKYISFSFTELQYKSQMDNTRQKYISW